MLSKADLPDFDALNVSACVGCQDSVMRRLSVQSAAQTLRSQDVRIARGRGRVSFFS